VLRAGFGEEAADHGVRDLRALEDAERANQYTKRAPEEEELVAVLEVLQAEDQARAAVEGGPDREGDGPVEGVVARVPVVIGIEAAHAGSIARIMRRGARRRQLQVLRLRCAPFRMTCIS